MDSSSFVNEITVIIPVNVVILLVQCEMITLLLVRPDTKEPVSIRCARLSLHGRPRKRLFPGPSSSSSAWRSEHWQTLWPRVRASQPASRQVRRRSGTSGCVRSLGGVARRHPGVQPGGTAPPHTPPAPPSPSPLSDIPPLRARGCCCSTRLSGCSLTAARHNPRMALPRQTHTQQTDAFLAGPGPADRSTAYVKSARVEQVGFRLRLSKYNAWSV